MAQAAAWLTVDDDDDDDVEDADNEVGFEADEFPRSSSMSCVSISIKSSCVLFSTCAVSPSVSTTCTSSPMLQKPLKFSALNTVSKDVLHYTLQTKIGKID